MTTSEISTTEKVPSRTYEVAYLVSASVPETALPEAVSEVRSALEKAMAFPLSDEFPKFRQLAYSLTKPLGGKNEKHASAYFGWMKFEAAAGAIPAIQGNLEKLTNLVRFLVVKADTEVKFDTRTAFWRKDAPKRKSPRVETKTGGSVISEAEIDKTIAELIVE